MKKISKIRILDLRHTAAFTGTKKCLMSRKPCLKAWTLQSQSNKCVYTQHLQNFHLPIPGTAVRGTCSML